MVITSLRNKSKHFYGKIAAVQLLGFPNTVQFTRNDEGLRIDVAGRLTTEYPVCFRITLE